SRNLTFDRCWDTLLRLDEQEAGGSATAPDTKPLISFLRALPDLAVSLDPARRTQIAELSDSLADASFEIPDGFDAMEFLPFGLNGTAWPFPQTADRAILISPFLDITATTRATSLAHEVRIMSRPESLDRVGTNAVGPTAETWTLQRPAEIGLGDDSPSAERPSHEGATVRDGLHAKTFVFDSGSTSTVLTGSANLTSAAFGGNVEFNVLLTGPIASCGVASVWDGSAESPGLSRLAQRYEPKAVSEDDAARANLECEIDRFHAELAIRGARLEVSTAGDELVDLVLDIARVDGPGATHVWPISLPRNRGRVLDQQAQLRWEAIDRRNITPFVAVETVARSGGAEVSSRMVLKAVLSGDVGDRRAIAMSEILRNQADVLRYLALLLADPSLDPSTTGGGDSDAEHDWERRARIYDLVVLEPLMRASLRNDDALKRVANLIRELQTMEGGSTLLPEGFRELWGAVWEARGGLR
ncbi:MAG: phospholipase D family protein, partial [Jatrophihabitantaceae bacterium]